MVARIDTAEAFEGVARAMFEDRKVTPQRLMVLEVFARDVSGAHPEIRVGVMQCFHRVLRNSLSVYNWLCYAHSKYDFPFRFADVVQMLVSLFL